MLMWVSFICNFFFNYIDVVYSEDLIIYIDGIVIKILYFIFMKRIFDERDDK